MKKGVRAQSTYTKYPAVAIAWLHALFRADLPRAEMIQRLADRTDQQRALDWIAEQRTRPATLVLIVRADDD